MEDGKHNNCVTIISVSPVGQNSVHRNGHSHNGHGHHGTVNKAYNSELDEGTTVTSTSLGRSETSSSEREGSFTINSITRTHGSRYEYYIDPRGRPTVTAGSDRCFCTCRPYFQTFQNKFQEKTIIDTCETVGLAEWIIDDTCLVLHYIYKPNYHKPGDFKVAHQPPFNFVECICFTDTRT